MSKAKQFRESIKNFFSQRKVGSEFKSGELISHIKKETGVKMFYPDSALRQLRKLREKGELNYTCLCKTKMIYQKTKTIK